MIDTEAVECRIKLSVCIVTFNQEKYVRQCIESILNQVVDFEYEIIVGDDFSTDNTRLIVEEISRLYPVKIKKVFHNKNFGPVRNYLLTHGHAVGEYIAHMDGDDYALPRKLQSQVDFLDNNKNFNVVWHRVKYSFSDGRELDDLVDYKKIENGFDRKDLIQYTFLANHSTKMYRRTQREHVSWRNDTFDYFFNIEHAQSGRAGYIGSNILGVYRVGIGVSTDKSSIFRKNLIQRLYKMAHSNPGDRDVINCAALTLMLSDVKSISKTSINSFKLWLCTVSINAMKRYRRHFQSRKMYATPK